MRHKVGRNQPCICGSGLKYKRCCGRISKTDTQTASLPRINTENILERHRADEQIRKTQQGLGRPIISVKFQNQQGVAVSNRIYFSPTWKTFPDFLAGYLKKILRADWGNAEIAKPLKERHPIMQWYDNYCHYQHEYIKKPGEIYNTPVTGIVACYLGLAYSIYLLDHNVELQTRLVHRLKDPKNFQGAYYELIVANILIRAGFTLTLEDETDAATKHCEFSAVSTHTGKKYWVEAKMRSVIGLLGKNEKDGTSNRNSISQLIPHLNGALKKPATDERLIFIDLNAEPEFTEDRKPTWHDKAIARLERYEVENLKPGEKAYVFVTNMAFHRKLAEEPVPTAAPFGLGMPDFNRPGYFRLSETYRQKQRHIDAYKIGDSLLQYTRFPATLDGRLPSESFGTNPSRVMVGETYFFESVGEKGLIGTVTTATVNSKDKEIFIGVTDPEGKSQILKQSISDDELADYNAHPDAYFGKVVPVSKKIHNSFDLFEWLIESYKGLSRAALLERLSKAPDFDGLKDLTDSDLLIDYCEREASALSRLRSPKDPV
jgi:hypothetical protein